MPLRIWSLGSPSYFLGLLVVVLLLMELRWMEPEMGGGGGPASSLVKLVCCFFDAVGIAAVLSLSSHRGGGDAEEFLGDAGGSKKWRRGTYPPL
jgi:hypothetical protein